MSLSNRDFKLTITGLVTLGILVTVGGCPAREVAKVDPNQDIEGLTQISVEINRDIDILFVIDNSGSMAEEQASLAANFSRFINVLENIEGGLPNVHIGVVSTDVGAGPFSISGCSGSGDNGQLQDTPRGAACKAPTGAFIKDIDDGMGGRSRNYDSSQSLADTFSCIAKLGIDGCGFEQPLESMKRALNGSQTKNAGFLRDTAFLTVILITDEDDCSTMDTNMFDTSQTTTADPLGPLSSFRCFEFGVKCEPDSPRQTGPRQDCVPRNAPRQAGEPQYMVKVAEYVTFLQGLKTDSDNIIVAGIIGNPTPVTVGTNEMGNPKLQPSCGGGGVAGIAADPGVRLNFFLDQFPGRSTATTICNEDLSDALIIIAQLLAKIIGNPCIVGEIDTKPMDNDCSDDPSSSCVVDGRGTAVQYDCSVSYLENKGKDNQKETPIPHCDTNGDTAPCFKITVDATMCKDTLTKLLLDTKHLGSLPNDTVVEGHCVVKN